MAAPTATELLHQVLVDVALGLDPQPCDRDAEAVDLDDRPCVLCGWVAAAHRSTGGTP